jgi:hypothetical protein
MTGIVVDLSEARARRDQLAQRRRICLDVFRLAAAGHDIEPLLAVIASLPPLVEVA